MRIKFLLAGLLGVATTAAFAQKYETSHAKDSYEQYTVLSKVKATYDEADKNLLEARRAIDKAAANSKSATLPATYAVRAAVYATFAMRDTSKKNTMPFFKTADSAYRKAKETDVNGENKKLIDDAGLNLAQYQLNQGVADYSAKRYDAAYKDFDYYHQLFPQDTTALYYSGLAAYAGNNMPNALGAYSKLLTLDFSKKASLYLDMSTIYLSQKDTTNSLKYATEGVEKFPASTDLRRREIELSLLTGKSQEVMSKIQAAIANDPKNKTLYYYAGLTYTSSASVVDMSLQKLRKTSKDAAAIAALQAKRDDALAKAAEMYKKALEIDPNYFEPNLNIGSAYLSPGIDLFNDANQLPPSKQKEYNAMMAKAAAQFELAKPYLLKAVELDPKSRDALGQLKIYYKGTRDSANVSATQAKIDALPNK
ncbi:hypothetical protein [Mucilaginibacter sp. dw_454]|uniref:tetratricopeptide repeat protein n=1 Tax=Mucilaginibacter sp. dw_454 TaxID=2720079 RepID=UPI001BD412D8|nr:hypothetical protein [Mucilaginibacter sp. dw_454]